MDGTLTLTNDLARLADVAHLVHQFGEAHRLGHETRFALNLALDELVTNTISYGFDGVAEPRITVRLALDGEAIVVHLADNGLPFDPLSRPEVDTTVPLEDRPIGGLGVHFVRQVMDELHYEHAAGENRLTLRRRLRPGDGIPDEQAGG